MKKPVRVLFVWPGTDGAAAGNFGVPQLVGLATWLRQQTGAEVRILDLIAEAALGPIQLDKLFEDEDRNGYDVIAFSVYSSFDHLKCEALAQIAREQYPEALICCGGYQASARPTDYVYDGSPYDVCVIGEGEHPLVRIVESVAGGDPIRGEILGSDPVKDLSILPASDWTFLDRYKGVARKIASQAQVYLSRGCPFDCAFCMERAKREVSWRPLPVDRAVEEIVSLHEYIDLSSWTLYIADALFGMKKSWRREFLDKLAAKNLPIEKLWLLIRVDLVEDEDLRLFADANCGLGFGLESGDQNLLAAIRKAGRLDTYLERMREVAAWARERNVPWGANVICGHPGETPDSMRNSAKYLSELFLDPKGITGFLSVDPFRLYPGSPIDENRGYYESTYGTRFYRSEWWHDGDPEFLAEWVDPSSELTWSERERLQHELLGPVLAGIEDNFVYSGGSREYFLRAVREQVRFGSAQNRLHYIDRYYAWMKYTGFGSRADEERRKHETLHELAREKRRERLPKIAKIAKIAEGHRVLDAIERVPRELFVPLDQTAASARDVAIALDPDGHATVSAMHAYARAFSLLDVKEGDRVLDLGAGSGYGTAILGELCAQVTAVEIDPNLVERAADNGIDITVGDATDPASWPTADVDKVYVGFALEELPASWREALPSGVTIVAPLSTDDGQRLARAVPNETGFEIELFEQVRYVPTRQGPIKKVASTRASADRSERRLPVVD